MTLQLWIGEGGYFFVDVLEGQPIQVGQAYRENDSWVVEVNGRFLPAPDFETAKRLFVEKYDRALVQPSPGAFDIDEDEDLADGFSIIDLLPLEKSLGRVQ
jgi:hypothetical protein